MLARPLVHATGWRAPDVELLLVLFPVLVAALVVVIVAVTLLSRHGLLPPLDEGVPAATSMTILASALSFGAAALHNAAIADHFAQDPVVGATFVAAVVFQAGWGVLYLALPGAAVAAAGLIASDALVLFWAWPPILGLPFGAHPGVPEPVSFIESLAAVFEVLLIVLLVARLAPPLRPVLRRHMRFGNVAVVTTFAIVGIAIVTGVTVTWAAVAE
ncbi:MAG: hypothetical protein FJ038_01050 [Chloroflexi bacterium]|nr:hypothetical protein [Chloroflexota bacterium]